MTLEYIRKYYGVPAKRGQQVHYKATGSSRIDWQGRIVGASGGRLRVRFDGHKRTYVVHPADDGLHYLPTAPTTSGGQS